jgi:hypothetical protein
MSNLNLPVANNRAFSTASIRAWAHAAQLRTCSLGEHGGGFGCFAEVGTGVTA